jgi:hypothetical protein
MAAPWVLLTKNQLLRKMGDFLGRLRTMQTPKDAETTESRAFDDALTQLEQRYDEDVNTRMTDQMRVHNATPAHRKVTSEAIEHADDLTTQREQDARTRAAAVDPYRRWK